MARVLFLEPWYGGSHRAFLDSWSARSTHDIVVIGLAPRHWQWRMEASAWELARRIDERGAEPPDVLAVSDYVDLPRLLGSLPKAWRGCRTLAYFHENQLTYPSASEHPTTSYGFTNVLTAIGADVLAFNSEFHRRDFAAAADELLSRLPKPNPRAELEAAIARSHVVAPCPELEAVPLGVGSAADAPTRVLFPHRLEPDKDPAAFARAVRSALDRGAELEVVLVGGDLDGATAEVRRAIESISSVVVSTGYVESRGEYLGVLGTCDVVVSTARHEFFGVAVAEAMAAGCVPLVPDRLAYPEVHAAAFTPYRDENELVDRLAAPKPTADRENARQSILAHDAGIASQRLDSVAVPER